VNAWDTEYTVKGSKTKQESSNVKGQIKSKFVERRPRNCFQASEKH